MSELLSMEQAMAEITRLTDKAARLDKLCAELWCKNDKLTKECADLTNLNVIHVRQLKRKDGYLAKYHENWEIAATLLNATTEHADKTQKECVDLIYKTTRVAQDTELS
jgi:hypothetical protein